MEKFKFPRDWPEVTPEPKDPRDVAIAKQLERPLPEVNFDGAAFHDVIDFFRDVSGANIFVNWKALQNAGIDRNVPVTVRMTNVKFSKALQIVLDSVGGKEKLGYHVEDGVITVSMADDLDRDTDTRVYDIRDLLVTVPDVPARDGPLRLPRDADGDPAKAAAEDPDNTRKQLAEDVIRLVKETVDPDQWEKSNRVRHLQGQLIITAPPETHGSIARLLDQLRDSRGIQLVVETRFIALGEGALAKLEPPLREKVERIIRAGDPKPEQKESEPKQAGFILDEGQAREILNAINGDKGSGVLVAPRFTLFNGQRAHVLLAEETPYVSGYSIVNLPNGGVKYEPRVDTAQAGFVVETVGTVSADRKYVTLTLWPRLSHLDSIVEVPWEKGPPEEKLTVQRPKLRGSEMQMTVSVPDGATLAAGGLRGVVEVPGDEEAPQERDLLMLVKPRIIIQREVEVRSAPVKSERR
ncbi:MAG TPA: hypothetical protein VFB66_31545 [Tepidisphaeraceae bacterium]|nr:hypothetical protein [Tepidisphaeraceae bacterium]